MKSVSLSAYPRTQIKRSAVKKLRTTGRIPAVIYGRNTQPRTLEIQSKDIKDIIHHSHSENLLLDLTVNSDQPTKHLALVKEVQHNPLSGKILHMDLHEVHETEKVTLLIPIEPLGEALGVKGGGTIERVLSRVRIRALPKDIPDVLSVDVTHLDIGKAIRIGDIQPPAGVEILGNKNLSVLSVAAPISEAEEAAATATPDSAVVGDVEMIKEKKEDGEEGAAAPAAKGAAKAAPAAAGDKAAAAAPAAAAKGAEKKPEKKK